MRRYITSDGVEIALTTTSSNLGIYRACRAVGLLYNETHSALDYSADETEITVHRTRDGAILLTLERADQDA